VRPLSLDRIFSRIPVHRSKGVPTLPLFDTRCVRAQHTCFFPATQIVNVPAAATLRGAGRLNGCGLWGWMCRRSGRSTRERFLHPRVPTRSLGKEVIQPQVPLRLPCYDFAPVIKLAFDRSVPRGFSHGLRALPTSMA
jgi:hypothetical protein